MRDALAFRDRWRARTDALFDRVAALALPVMGAPAPPVGPLAAAAMTVAWTLPVNLAGLPALALPAGPPGRPTAGLQLVGRAGTEEVLCAAGGLLEGARSAQG
jgi:Asp-tRNA(Asn)/Glu-tRNA(Gln) amidotransferase A subunit family amidase